MPLYLTIDREYLKPIVDVVGVDSNTLNLNSSDSSDSEPEQDSEDSSTASIVNSGSLTLGCMCPPLMFTLSRIAYALMQRS